MEVLANGQIGVDVQLSATKREPENVTALMQCLEELTV